MNRREAPIVAGTAKLFTNSCAGMTYRKLCAQTAWKGDVIAMSAGHTGMPACARGADAYWKCSAVSDTDDFRDLARKFVYLIYKDAVTYQTEGFC